MSFLVEQYCKIISKCNTFLLEWISHNYFIIQKRRVYMFNNRTTDGRNNICGINVAKLRKSLKISQRELADRLQVINLDIDKNAVQRIESGQRFVTDIEIIYLAKVFSVTVEDLLKV